MRVPIRDKLLLVIVAILLLVMGSYLTLATTLFTRDKLAYIYDLNSTMVETLAEQTRSQVSLLADKVLHFYQQAGKVTGEDRDRVASELFQTEPSLLRIEIFARSTTAGTFRVEQGLVNDKLLDELRLTGDDLELMRRERPLPLEAVAAGEGRIYLVNSSLPPDAVVLTILVRTQPRSGPALIVAADFNPEQLLRLYGRSKLYETYLVDESGGILAHPSAARVVQHENLSRFPLVAEALRTNLERGVTEFAVAGADPMLGAYAKVEIGRLVVLTQISKSEALQASRELIQRSVLFAVAILLAAFIASVFFARLLTAPIRRLREASLEIGKGNYDVPIRTKSRDEIGDLANSLRQMTRMLKDTQAQLVRTEKLATFGQLGAGITHEVKNPITGIIGFAQLCRAKIQDTAGVLEMLQLIEREAKRCSDILVNFLKFVRVDRGKFEAVLLNDVILDAAKICKHHLLINKVDLELKLYEKNLPVRGNAAEIQQVFLNLAINAQQAMPDGGTVVVGTGAIDNQWVTISVADNGPGIPAEIQDRIFEPFFTTKAAGTGTGLGLSIVHSIIHDHQGTISVSSQVGKGATFTIRLPVLQAGA